ncbi:MAG: hypothetical protein QNJ54_22005 [Prochloraceae cyanobacterium]|nr:hypothetical protein [Prochloraceae cyanobacterium]
MLVITSQKKTCGLRVKEIGAKSQKSLGLQIDKKFSSVETSGRILSCYSGFLPGWRFRARHILRCEHLRNIPGERFPPYRAHSSLTHQLWLWYRLNQRPDRLELLFRGQFDLSFEKSKTDEVAKEITAHLADLLTEGKTHPQELFRHLDSHQFWLCAIETKLKTLTKV